MKKYEHFKLFDHPSLFFLTHFREFRVCSISIPKMNPFYEENIHILLYESCKIAEIRKLYQESTFVVQSWIENVSF